MIAVYNRDVIAGAASGFDIDGEVPEWSTKSPGAILNRGAARRAAGRTPVVNGPDSTKRRSRLGRTKCAHKGEERSDESNQVY